MKIRKISILLAMMLAVTFSTQAQLGGLLNKAKEKVKTETKKTAEKQVEKQADKLLNDGGEETTGKKMVETVSSATGISEISGGSQYTRVKPTSEYFNAFVRSYKPKKTEWNSSSPNSELTANLSYLIREDLKIINSGDFEEIAKSYKDYQSGKMTIRKILEQRAAETGDISFKSDAAMARTGLDELRFDQTQLLFPGMPYLDANSFYNDDPMTKRQYYDRMDYFIMMAKKEKSEILRKLSIDEAITLRNKAKYESYFKDEDVEADDPQWINADKELKALGVTYLTPLEDMRKAADMEKELNLEDAREANTKNIPKAAVKDPALEANVMALAKSYWGTARTPVKVILTQKDWQINTNAFGKVLGRWKKVTVITRTSNKKYYMHTCTLGQLANGSQFNAPTFSVDAFEGNREGEPINWKE